MVKIEIRLVERRKGKIHNVEIYNKEEFDTIIRGSIVMSVEKFKWYEKLSGRFPTKIADEVIRNLTKVFEERLIADLNK